MGKFKFIETELPGVLIVEPTVFGDERGYFMETFQKEEFAAAGITDEFVQDNQSRSSRGVLRGVHFQKEHTQGKLVRVTKGEVFDYYDPSAEGGIPYDDATVGIRWPDCGCEYLLSEKDKHHTPFASQTFEYFERW